MAYWGGSKLLSEITDKQIVEPFHIDMIDCSALTLTVGSEAYVTPLNGDSKKESIKQYLDAPTYSIVGNDRKKQGGGIVAIPSGQFAFLLTEEIVKIPTNAMGFISLKSKPKFGGLINVSGFHVDPGFHGRLIYSLFNAGPNTIHISRGDPLFLLWIADLSGPVSSKYHKTNVGYTEIPSELISKVSRENHSLQSLSENLGSGLID
jgi:dCTP deaminase